MGLKARVRQLEKVARGGMDWLDLSDGSRYYFEPMQVHKDLFMEEMDGFRAMAGPDLSEGASETEPKLPQRAPRVPEIRVALARATPESLRRFEEHYGPAERECAVIHNDGRITIRCIALDGSASSTVLEGEEARQYRAEARLGDT
jgi:hypothetical protein